MKHRFSIVVENKAGVLARILGVLSARNMNVESLQVEDNHAAGAGGNTAPAAAASGLALITMVTTGDEVTVERVAQKIGQQVRVLEITREVV